MNVTEENKLKALLIYQDYKEILKKKMEDNPDKDYETLGLVSSICGGLEHLGVIGREQARKELSEIYGKKIFIEIFDNFYNLGKKHPLDPSTDFKTLNRYTGRPPLNECKYFKLGATVMTRGISEAIEETPGFKNEVFGAFARYIKCDWGEMSKDDKDMSDSAVKNNDDRIFAAYDTSKGKIYIITEYDRSATTILFEDEY